MADGSKETCVGCKFHEVVKKHLLEFPNGGTYMVTGICNNDRSVLYRKHVAGNLTAQTNVIYKKLRLVDFKPCFVQK